MQAFNVVSGAAAALPAANIDTDIIMPKQFLKGIDRSGLADGAFHDLRFDRDGMPRQDFILNQPDWEQTCFLVTGPNFGCGSSREHAVWGLLQLGVRAIIGSTFAGIFHDNALNNGLLLISLPSADVASLMARAADPKRNGLTVDLPQQTVETQDGLRLSFEIEPLRKRALIGGLDAIGVTLQNAEAIHSFERPYFDGNPWLA
jgi:3-isopropylmalate/(R)-2-methylmalate dehydratase small subunit